ncbi:dihydropteroate synthase [Algoriphagus sediminis]|uniref:dihydropteroate synthase n=1 Tax=Algoriphagus sediminis TaxID=3057113 RepID=A0ABT7Y896_9BACT|nr:dihydropteroate synthase [Algoriphagus sediminis]MDN3202729.1 dihydropteroate synthase [Algoriphagus sediminis]
MIKELRIEDNFFPQKNTVNLQGRLSIWDSPKVMGIVNLTSDSFFEQSRIQFSDLEFGKRIEKIIQDGADMLDFGGYSSRPGAKDISIEEELSRVIPAIQWVAKKYPYITISVDTFRSEVARESVLNGAHIVNDISAGNLDSKMIKTVGELRVPYIAMHMRGNPRTMQNHTEYSDLIPEILYYFSYKLEKFRFFGINDVIIDVGFGFAKSVDQNYQLLKNLAAFKSLSCPILVGISRKSMIYKTLGINPDEALNGTTALHMVALQNGGNILRVHDVKEAKETIELYKKLYP